jgi:hypothetical protein
MAAADCGNAARYSRCSLRTGCGSVVRMRIVAARERIDQAASDQCLTVIRKSYGHVHSVLGAPPSSQPAPTGPSDKVDEVPTRAMNSSSSLPKAFRATRHLSPEHNDESNYAG